MGRDILLINDNLDTGGVEKILQSVAARLSARGDRLTLWACNGDRETLRRCYPAGVRFRKYPFWYGPCKRFSPRWFFSRACRLLFEGCLLRLKKWDTVLAVKEGESMLLASRLRAGRKVAWIHTDYEHFHWTGYLFRGPEGERACMAGFDRVICVSRAVRDSVCRTVGDPGNLRVLYSPIDAKTLLRRAAETPPDCVRPQGKPLLVSVGRLTEVKRYGLLLELCARLARRYDFELWIIGGGELEESLRRQLREEGPVCAKLLGNRDNPYPYMACADWVLSASASESYGLTIQEALVLGVPVLAAACPAVAETLDSRWGLLTGQAPEELERGLEEILARPELGARLRENLRKYDRSGLWEPRMEALCAEIDGAKNKKAAPRSR